MYKKLLNTGIRYIFSTVNLCLEQDERYFSGEQKIEEMYGFYFLCEAKGLSSVELGVSSVVV